MNNQQKIDKYIDNLITQAEKQTTRIYAKRYKEIKKEIEKLYFQMERTGTPSLNEAMRYNRLDKSLDFIIGELLKAQGDAYKLAQQTMEQTFLENYYRTAFLMEFETQQKLGFGLLTQELIESAVQNPIEKLKLPAIRERNRKQIVDRIRNEMAQGLARGSSYSEMTRIIRDVVSFDAHKSRTVVATEAHRTQVEGRYRSMEQASKYVKVEKMWDASLDKNTRSAHRKLDGKVIPKDENFRSPNGGRGKAPGHMNRAADDINCRCSLVTVVNGRTPEVRRERLEDGTTAVIPYTKYEDWQEARLKKRVVT